ncbi:hypothetical protein EDEG_00063 [Edhazardia aedis USNM 41457]|uniref:HIT domain-containing protein n=1 Tax=Edhazardia aedis (strain USNM 41457) TaxID=1003232 RepID=J8ZZY7_EDHAE|nr:hypothetical protein EDEG_00063 [Edhazardia aedis USNM 41457]|eukprot:EJW05208.1 hypothetical protein EDEG_00063 [Edhazardia aedis USNM 41457]
MDTCIFCKIINDKVGLLYETDRLVVILDKFPLSYGHLLVIPKSHCRFYHEMDDMDLKEIACTIKKIVKTCGFEKYNVLQNNKHIQSVYHVHFHIIPCDFKINNNSDSIMGQGGLNIKWETLAINEEALKSLKKFIKDRFNEIR